MAQRKPNGMTRAQAAQLYDDLKSSLEQKHGKQRIAKLMKEEQKKASTSRGAAPAAPRSSMTQTSSIPVAAGRSGAHYAILLVVVLASAKIVFSVLEAAGILRATPAIASQLPANYERPINSFSKEELHVLKSLDARRVSLEERNTRLERKSVEIKRRDREFAARLSEIREISEKLKLERKKGEKKRSTQLDQLANVYSSMNPEESAKLIEQLDVTIALSLIGRMPEKRIGQILSLMSPERALTLTQMLSR